MKTSRTSFAIAMLAAIALVLALAPISQAGILTNLELYLPMDGNVTDTSGNAAVTSINGATAFTGGKVGQAIDLDNSATSGDGTPAYVNAGAAANLNFGLTTDFSVQFWVNTTSDFPSNGFTKDDPAIISNKDWDSGANQGWFIGAGANGRMQWNIGDGPGPAGRMDYDGPGGQINDGEWHHIVVSFDRDTSVLTYVDGSLVDTKGPTDAFNIDTPAGYETRVGTDGAAGDVWPAFFDGTIDEVAIWSQALTEEDVATLYNNGDGMTVPEPASGLLLIFGSLGLMWLRRRS